MACYWGCGTRGNKIAWALVTGMSFIGTILILAGIIGNWKGHKEHGKSCFDIWVDCVDGYYRGRELEKQEYKYKYTRGVGYTGYDWVFSEYSFDECYNFADRKCKMKDWVGLLSSGTLFLILAAMVPSYFCCCSRRPSLPALPVAAPAAGQYVQMSMPEARPMDSAGATKEGTNNSTSTWNIAARGGWAYPPVAPADQGACGPGAA